MMPSTPGIEGLPFERARTMRPVVRLVSTATMEYSTWPPRATRKLYCAPYLKRSVGAVALRMVRERTTVEDAALPLGVRHSQSADASVKNVAMFPCAGRNPSGVAETSAFVLVSPNSPSSTSGLQKAKPRLKFPLLIGKQNEGTMPPTAAEAPASPMRAARDPRTVRCVRTMTLLLAAIAALRRNHARFT